MAAWDRATEDGGFEVVHRFRHADERAYRWFQTRATPVRDEAGRIVEWLGTSTDLQDMKRLHERQAVMVVERQHRMRNLLTVVRSIATQTMASTGPTEAFRQEFNDRLAALSRVQGMLSRSEQEPITLRALLRLELEALGAKDDEAVRLDGPPVRIRPTIVQTLALAFHELATNARKYGALSERGGWLSVTWQRRDNDSGRRLFIEWREDDLAPAMVGPSAPEQGGYGRRLIERALPYALQAQTTYDLQPTALRCTIDLPLDGPGQERSPGT